MKVYSITITDDGNDFSMNRKNKGFTGFELLGFMEVIKSDLITQLASINKNKIKTTREYETDGKTGKIIINEEKS